MWHDGLIYKIKRIGITGNFLKLIESFLSNRFKWVVLNGKLSSWTQVYAGVPQGSILGPLFLLIYINDFSKGISSTVHPYSQLLMMLYNVSVRQLNDLLKISKRA